MELLDCSNEKPEQNWNKERFQQDIFVTFLGLIPDGIIEFLQYNTSIYTEDMIGIIKEFVDVPSELRACLLVTISYIFTKQFLFEDKSISFSPGNMAGLAIGRAYDVTRVTGLVFLHMALLNFLRIHIYDLEGLFYDGEMNCVYNNLALSFFMLISSEMFLRGLKQSSILNDE